MLEETVSGGSPSSAGDLTKNRAIPRAPASSKKRTAPNKPPPVKRVRSSDTLAFSETPRPYARKVYGPLTSDDRDLHRHEDLIRVFLLASYGLKTFNGHAAIRLVRY